MAGEVAGVEEWIEIEIEEVVGEWVEVEGEVAEEEVAGEVAGVEIGEVEWVGAERRAGAEELTEAWADWSASRALLTRRAWIPWIP